MSTPGNPHREQPNTYVMQDPFHKDEEELKRLLLHDQIFTTGMGGVLPEQSDPARFQRVLDIGCGPGSWLIEAARTYPAMSLLIGVDISLGSSSIRSSIYPDSSLKRETIE